jgi:hypothetical protein
MQEPLPGDDAAPFFVIEDRASTRFFSHFGALRYLRPFLARECGVADAAEQLSVSRQRMNYWVNKLLRARLIRRVRTDRSTGRPMAVYRTVHDRITLPLSALPHATIEGLLDFLVGQWWWERFKRAFSHAWQPGLKSGCVRVFREGENGAVEPLPQSSAVDEAIHNHWRQMNLTAEQVARFRSEMEELVERFYALSAADAEHTVLVHAAIVRERPH